MIDLVLLRMMQYRRDFGQLYPIVKNVATIDAKTKAIIEDFGRYFQEFPSHDKIDVATFVPVFRRWHASLNSEQVESYNRVFVNMASQTADDDQKNNILKWLAETELANKLENLVAMFNEGELDDTFGSLQRIGDEYRKRLGIKFTGFIDVPIEDLLADEFDDAGLKWRLKCLNESMRGLRPGDFGIIAGRPDKGKTSFIASEITFMAPQLPEDRNVLWLNNEGPGKRIIPRIYQAALGLTMEEMKRMSNEGKLVEAYRKFMGRLDKVRVFDIHSYNTGQVEMIMQDNNPGLVVYDMIDNIRGFGDAARTDLALEQMYQWARERSVNYDCVGLATSQISNEGDGLQFPTLGMLKDSKTGKQGACDFQLMIGAVNDPGFGNSRFIGLPKNKLRRPGHPTDPRAEVLFDMDRSIYKSIPRVDDIAERVQVQPAQAPVNDDELEGLSQT